MKTRAPTLKEIDEIVSFLPRLYQEGVALIKKWSSGTKGDDGVFTMPWPEYDPVVEDFFRIASYECWSAYEYCPEDARRMLENEYAVDTADLAQIKTMLTYCVRGERFCDGHWGAMIEGGYVRRLLKRLNKLGSRNA